jgi:hypothetical protein
MINYSVLSLLSLWCIPLFGKSAGLRSPRMLPEMTMFWGCSTYSMLFLFSNLISQTSVPKLLLTMWEASYPVANWFSDEKNWTGKTSGRLTDLRTQLGSASQKTSRGNLPQAEVASWLHFSLGRLLYSICNSVSFPGM